jgi:leucyl/phenylalanyl-tRNA--protein transferase
VISACATARRPGQLGTWITPAIIDAYTVLHENGYAHSVEAWRDGKLVGGLYGVAIGRMFFGESMFAREADASKVALAQLMAMLRAREFPLVDCQQETEHLASFGARPIPRAEFADLVAGLVHSTAPGSPWTPYRLRTCSRDQAQRPSASVTAVLRDCSVPCSYLPERVARSPRPRPATSSIPMSTAS